MNNLYDALEICLQEMETGADLESILSRYPHLAGELRPILNASLKARARAGVVSDPSPDAARRGRAKVLQRALEMREQKVTPRKRIIPIFQRLAISLTLTALFLASGTGLVSASSSSLPGENLYPVKRTWEDLRLFLTFNPDHKEFLESEFENERLDEVSELLAERRHATIQYSGVFMQVNNVMYVSGVKVLIPADLQIPANGAAVVITGKTDAQGFVEVESIEVLPDGAIVPVGEPVELEDGSGAGEGENSNSGSGSENESGPESSNEAQGNEAGITPEATPRSFELKSIIESVSENILIINGQTYYLGNAKIDGELKPGVSVEIKGFYAPDGSFVITEVKVLDAGSGNNDNSGSDQNSNEDGGDNSNNDASNGNDSHSGGGDDNGGSGGGGGGGGGGGSGGDD